jgi:hypothetical protein
MDEILIDQADFNPHVLHLFFAVHVTNSQERGYL